MGKYDALYDDTPAAPAEKPAPSSRDSVPTTPVAAPAPGRAPSGYEAAFAAASAPEAPKSKPTLPEGDRPGAVRSGLLEAQQALTFGTAPLISAGLDYVADKALGRPADFLGQLHHYSGDVDAARTDHPVATTLGGIAGGVASGAMIPVPAAVGSLTPALRGAVMGAGTAGAQAAGEGASHGKNLVDISQDVAKAELGGAALGGALGRFTGNASERVADRALRQVTAGETNANARTARKVAERALVQDGENAGAARPEVRALFEREPELEHALATTAAHNPRAAAAAVTDVIAQSAAETGPMVDSITQHTGGPRVLDLVVGLDKKVRDLGAAGHVAAADAVDRFRQSLLNRYGTEGKISEHTRISARAVQNMKNDVAQVAFGNPAVPANLRAQVSRDVWGVLAGAMEAEGAKVPGLDLNRLRSLNRDISTLIPMRQALEERAQKATASTLGDKARTALPYLAGAAGFGHGGVKEGAAALLAGVALPAIGRGLASAGRSADYYLARLMAGAEAGMVPQKLIAEAITAGVPAATAHAIAEHSGGPSDAAR